jgi:hypothetical protein
LLLHGQVRRVDQQRKIRAATDGIGFIDRFVSPFREVRAERSGKMPAGREAEHTDPARIDPQFARPLPDQAHRPLRVLQRSGPSRLSRTHRHAILDQHRGHTQGIEPLADFGALQVHGEDGIPASRKDQYG